MNHWMMLPIILPLVTGLMLLLSGRVGLRGQRTVAVVSTAALLPVGLALLGQAADGSYTVYALGGWAPPFGIVLVLDRLSALMLVLTATLALPALMFAVRGSDAVGSNFHALFQFQLMGLNGAFLTGDLFNLFVFFEVLLIASYSLLMHGNGPGRSRAGLHYVVLNLIGSSLFLFAVGALYGITGTLNMADLAVKVAQIGVQDAAVVRAAALMLLVVFGLKAGLLPLYFWLPRAYAEAPTAVAALFAVMTKVGVYAIVRVYTLIFGDDGGLLANSAWPWLWPLALLTLAAGAVGALAARDLGTLIAYLVVVSVGTLLAGIALATPEALNAALYYLIHTTLVTGGWFLLVGVLRGQRGAVADLFQPSAPVSQPAIIGGLFFLGAVAVAGLPPLSGFIGKLLLLSAVPPSDTAVWLWSVVLVAGLIVLVALSRAGSCLFWRTLDQPAVSRPADPVCLGSALTLLVSSPMLVFFAAPVMDFTRATAEQLLTPSGYVAAVVGEGSQELAVTIGVGP